MRKSARSGHPVAYLPGVFTLPKLINSLDIDPSSQIGLLFIRKKTFLKGCRYDQ
jgi:hypothetical protein